MTGFAGALATFRIDLNGLRGNQVITSMDRLIGLVSFGPGDLVRAVEEEGDAYLAIVDHVAENGLVYLKLDLESLEPFEPYDGATEKVLPSAETGRVQDMSETNFTLVT